MDRRIQKTRDSIRQAYFELLKETGKTKLSVAEIARRANIDRKTFYLHYQTPDDIMKDFENEKIQELLSLLRKDGFFEHPFDIDRLFHTLKILAEEDMDLYRYAASHESWNFFWEEIEDMIVKTLYDVYFDAVHITKDKFTVYAEYVSSGIVAVFKSWLKEEITMGMDEFAKTAADIAYYGVQKIVPVQ